MVKAKNTAYHVPVLRKECMEGLAIRPDGTYVDVTFGGGGHSLEILERLDNNGHLYGFDRDADAERNVPHDERFIFIHGNFRHLYHFMRYHDEIGKVDGLLADLGVSSHHFDEGERGFSFRFDGALDMRMNRRAGRTAAEIVNRYTKAQLADIFHLYGELKTARQLASAIVRARAEGEITTTYRLLEVLQPMTGTGGRSHFAAKDKEKKFLAQVFQALRMEVNDEMGALKAMLLQTLDVLRPGGRLAVITYHSLEDRLVKNFLKTGNFDGQCEQDLYGNKPGPFRLLNSKVIVPTQEEITVNPRAHSAKLRIACLVSHDIPNKE